MRHVLTVWAVTAGVAATACAAPHEAPSSRAILSAQAVDGDRDGIWPDGVAGAYLAGRHAARSGDRASAAEFFVDALSARPEDAALRRHAFMSEALAGRISSAVELAEELAESDPADPSARLLLVVRDIKSGHFQDARDRLQSGADDVLETIINPLLLAWADFGAGKPRRATERLAAAQGDAAFQPIFAYHAALIYDLAGSRSAASDAYRAANNQLSASARLTLAYGRFLQRSNQMEKSRALYENFLAQAPDHPLITSELHATRKSYKPKRLISTPAQGCAEALYDLGSLLNQSLNTEALLYLRLSLYLDPDFDLAHLLLANMIEKSGRWENAATEYDLIPAASPLYETAQVQKAMGLDARDRPDEAIATLDALISKRPQSQSAVIARADILRMREHFTQAAAGYDRAIQMIGKPTERHWGLYYARGVSLERAHRWPEAEHDFLRALQLSPDEPLVLNYLGYSWIEQGEHLQRAQAMIEKAASQRPADGYIVDSLGWVLFRMGQYPEAVAQLERAVELRPEDPLINGHLGDAYWRVGRRLEARFQWRRALSLDPAPEVVEQLEKKLRSGLPADTAAILDKTARDRADLVSPIRKP